MSRYELAQLNIATLIEPMDSPRMADFVANLGPINALAEASPGYVWRLQDESGDATSLRPFGPDIAVNMSVWKDIASLQAYAFRSEHVAIMRRRREWFQRMDEAFAVLWWVPAGHRPTLHEAAERLASLRTHGPTANAFTFRDAFAPPDAIASTPPPDLDDACPAT